MFVPANLALFASLLYALALPSTDAAYLPGHRPETQNVHRFSPVLPPRFGRHNPVLSRHRPHADPERGHDKAHKSAFSRHRDHRDTGTLSRRSSVYVLGEHGDRYLVSRSGPGSNEQNSRSRVHGRRQSNQVVGRVDIMGTPQSSDSPHWLASLAVDSTPVDLMPGQNATKVFGVNASTANRTQFIMMVQEELAEITNLKKHIALAVEVFDAHSAKTVMYCATYDPDPAAPSELVMAPCATSSITSPSPGSDNAIDPSSSNPHQRQIFSYDPFSGQIQPVASISSTDSSVQDAHCGSAERRDAANSTTSSTATTLTSAASTPSPTQQAQSVTLVYVPEDLEVPASSRALGAINFSQGKEEEAVVTTTITTTVVATVTASTSPSRSATPAHAAAVSVSRTSSISTRSSTPLASTSATASSRSSSVANESLEIEIIGVTPTTTTVSSSSVSSMTTTHSSARASPTLNAQAVASSIANARSSRSQSQSSSSNPTAATTPVFVAIAGRSRTFGRK